MSPALLLITLSLTTAPAAPEGGTGRADAEVVASQGGSSAPDPEPTTAAPVAEEPAAEDPVAEATDVVAPPVVKAPANPGEGGHPVAPLPQMPAPDTEVSPAESNLVPHVSVVPSRAVPVKWAGIGITAVGIASYLGGQLVMDAADRMPVGPAKQERFEYGQSIRGGGLGAVITGVSIWFISNELARWEEAPAVGFVPVRDGGAVTFSVRLP